MAAFVERHLGPRAAEVPQLLATIGVNSLAELVDQVLPPGLKIAEPLELPPALTETATQQRLAELAALNNPGRSMIGLGYYGTITPAVIRRNVLENPAWYTAYTPYQPEISQGRLEALFNFQTMITDLTGLPVANASLLDEGTAVAEAVALARRSVRKHHVAILDPDLFPHSLAVVETRAEAAGWEVTRGSDSLVHDLQTHEAFAVVIQVPGASGRLRSANELAEIAAKAHENGALVIAVADPLALTLITPPAEWGADVVVGSTQRFGVPLFGGGPHAGYLAVRDGLERAMPGRLVGLSNDADGVPALRLALQTREQHIRREKATSNICTAQVLLAVVAAMYAVYHGPAGLREIARQIHGNTRRVAGAVAALGLKLQHEEFFDTLVVEVPGQARAVVAAARQRGIHLRNIDEDRLGISLGEDVVEADLKTLLAAFTEVVGGTADLAVPRGSLADHDRQTPFCTHPVFNSHHSETAMMRYLRTLADRDIALDRGMIPLGSCTMKLNAAASMEPISWPGFANLHPFVPHDDQLGTRTMVAELERWLAEITGYAAVSVQPNSGAQGEFAGLLAIRAYHRSRGEVDRDVCLIPSSAHGTNAASATMAGMRVAVIAANEDGSVDLEDLRAKLVQHEGRVAAAMVTYPSTHGVFEETISELCALVHEAGGQVYVDGANLNAMMGLAQPGKFGADVSHLNLHKTFTIPHGGGGPGVGPIGVREHLVPYLPGHPMADRGEVVGPVSAAPLGSPGVLPIPWAYIAMSGAEGLRAASSFAILSANYVAKRLADAYPVLYAGRGGLVAHECILDLRPLTKATGITVNDVAKRLVDFGFHAPTMSFPVAGTLMIEPTESEDVAELDRFCDAMLAIRAEIDRVASGEWSAEDNPLVNAPHPAARILADEWPHPYSRAEAAWPEGQHRSISQRGLIGGSGRDKYWPPVGRIDGAYGDRNLVCSCPPIDAYQED